MVEQRPGEAELRRLTMNGVGLALGGANVIMQLSLLPIGHGVAKSKVESGAIYSHPLKRFRTTVAYIAIALFGTDDERKVMRSEVNRQHRFVHAEPEEVVAYNAFDPELQLWVAACMFRGLVDAVRFFHGETGEEGVDLLYRASSRFATTLQVPDPMWPADRGEFERYFERASARVAMDDLTRSFLRGIASLDFLPAVISRCLGPAYRFMTVGFLPERFRRELGEAWDERRQRRFELIVSIVARVNNRLPIAIREFPFNFVLWDARRRIRRGTPII